MEVITRKDYRVTDGPLCWAILTRDREVMASGFETKADAESFRDNAYLGYYCNCEVQLIKR